MNLKISHLLIFFLLINYIANSQHVIITSSKGNDTITACFSEQIYFYAYLIDNNNDTLQCQWSWDMDDGTIFNEYNLDTIRYSFALEKAHRVFATATYNNQKFSNIIVVKVGLKPDFTGTETDLLPEQTGICKGDRVGLIGNVSDKRIWKDNPISIYLEPFPFQINNNIIYSNTIIRKDFKPDSILSNKFIIDSIGLLIVHENASDLRISLTAPNEETIILKQTGGNNNFFGEPSQGIDGALWYFWAPSASQTINSLSISNQMIPATSYLPDEDFDTLLNTKLNGEWTIKVEDLFPTNDGYVLGWAIHFNPNYIPDTLTYTCTYNINTSFWQGDNVNLSSDGFSEAYPQDYGVHPYKFYIKDNFGCFHDTTVSIIVEKPSFDLDKSQVFIGDSIQVQDLTSWSEFSFWDFGDQSPIVNNSSTYHKYFEKGYYTITLTAQSNSDCSDQDTAQVYVIPKPISLAQYNVFTPNGDGINDVFSFFNTPEEKIIAANIQTIDARIYDRNGNLVCKWTNPEQAIKGWDGTINNKGKTQAKEGFYYYVILITGKDEKKYDPITGFIYLHR